MKLITDTDRQIIEAWSRDQAVEMSITLVLGDHEKNRLMESFCHDLEDAAPQISVITSEDMTRRIPEIRIGSTVVFSGIPQGRELPPFLEALSVVSGKPAPVKEPIRKALSSIDAPVDLVVYVALECPHCPAVVSDLLPLAAASDRVRIHVIDGSVFSREAEADHILSVPTVILDGKQRWTGGISLQEVVDTVTGRDPSELSPESLKRILEEGGAAWISETMQKKGQVFPGFLPLLVHPLWSVRLGAMVVLEDLADSFPGIAGNVIPFLVNAFPDADVTVKGDIFYALGLTGDASTKTVLEDLARKEDHEELIEAARDALETIDLRL